MSQNTTFRIDEDYHYGDSWMEKLRLSAVHPDTNSRGIYSFSLELQEYRDKVEHQQIMRRGPPIKMPRSRHKKDSTGLQPASHPATENLNTAVITGNPPAQDDDQLDPNAHSVDDCFIITSPDESHEPPASVDMMSVSVDTQMGKETEPGTDRNDDSTRMHVDNAITQSTPTRESPSIMLKQASYKLPVESGLIMLATG